MKPSFIFLCTLSLLSIRATAQWSTVCSTGNGFVTDVAAYNNTYFATGFFTSLCNAPASYVAGMGAGGWNGLTNGIPDPGHALRVIGNDLYLAKYELTLDSNWVYQWNGTSFQKFGPGVYLTTAFPGNSRTPSIYDMAVFNGSLIVCGEFDRAGNKSISGIMRWTGTSWDSLGVGLGTSVTTGNLMYPHQLLVFNNSLYVCGNFPIAGGITVNGIARWDGSQWHAVGQGFNRAVYALAVFNGQLYAGGEFTASGTTPLNRIARWNGTGWEDPGFGLKNQNPNIYTYVHTLKTINNKLFISGGFDRVTVNGTDRIAGSIISFDGTAVDTLEGGVPGKEIEGITAFNEGILVSGGLNGSSYLGYYKFPKVAVPEIAATTGSVRLYPNPCNDRLLIETAGKHLQPFTLTDISGRVMLTGAVKEGKESIATDQLPEGMYFLRLGAGSQRIMVRH